METRLKNEIRQYWDQRAEGYSQVNQDELAGDQKKRWQKELFSHFPEKNREKFHILDIGTGPGFFAIILAEAGYRVTAIDFSEEMLKAARENAGIYADKIEFRQMDSHQLAFPDKTFDGIVSRNLTWVLQEPEKAYGEWYRVLKEGGCLLNFDANWYRFLVDDAQKALHKKDRKNVEDLQVEDFDKGPGIDKGWMEDIAMRVPMTSSQRPQWDLECLKKIGFSWMKGDGGAYDRVLSYDEKVNSASSPMFLIKAIR